MIRSAEKQYLQVECVYDVVEIPQSCMASAMSRLPVGDIWEFVSPPKGFDQSAMLLSYQMWEYNENPKTFKPFHVESKVDKDAMMLSTGPKTCSMINVSIYFTSKHIVI